MPIILHDDLKKNIENGAEARRLLRSFLDTKEPELVYFLYNTWNAQGKAITYKQIREMILLGDIDPEFINEWQQDYSVFVVKYLLPLYQEAMRAAAEELERKRDGFVFNSAADGIKDWSESMGAAFVTNSTNEQVAAIRAVVSRAAQMQDISVDSLARSIRAMVGLNRPQALANQNYFTRLIENGMEEKKALEKAIKYGAQQHRYRGHMIARTELAFAFNKGEDEGVRQAIDQGYLGHVVKVWTDAGDDRVCDICRSLHNQTHRAPIEMGTGFGFPTRLKISTPGIDRTPPAHPHCRCVVEYREVEYKL